MRKLISLLARIFIKDKDNYSSASVRSAYGLLCSIVGIVLNIILFGAKYFAGVLSGSVSITADSFNNLSDAASSFVTLLGFKLASQKPHSDHPFGHGRFEYISGLAVSFLIILMGIEVLKTSIAKIATPSDTEFSVVSAVILLLSVGVKLYMYIYNRNIGKKLDSAAMRATAFDCFGYGGNGCSACLGNYRAFYQCEHRRMVWSGGISVYSLVRNQSGGGDHKSLAGSGSVGRVCVTGTGDSLLPRADHWHTRSGGTRLRPGQTDDIPSRRSAGEYECF